MQQAQKRIALRKNALPKPLCEIIDARFADGRTTVIAIDGRCGSGKTTLAEALAAKYHCDIVHMDDFFLPPELRTPERYAEAGGNVHYERVMEEVGRPLLCIRKTERTRGVSDHGTAKPDGAAEDSACRDLREPAEDCGKLCYRRFDCGAMDYDGKLRTVRVKPLLIIEGTYSMRTEFRAFCDVTLFMTCAYETQLSRIEARSGKERLGMFRERWIPLEERYFAAMQTEQTADLVIETD